MDVMSDILSSMRLSGALVIDAELVAPFCVVSHYGPEDCARFFPVPAYLVPYHYVTEGRMWVRIGEDEPVLVEAGELVMLARNDRHLLFSEPGLAVQEIEDTRVEANGGPVRIRQGGDGPKTRMYCGYLGTTSPEPALMQNLPPLMKVRMGDGARQLWTRRSLQLAAGELQKEPETVARMTELLFGEAVRRYLESLPEGEANWLAGLREPQIAKALQLIHDRYADPWNVVTLAREVGLSRSAFAERFTALIGEPPMRYFARWRMKIAANLLRDGRRNSGVVAFEVGFSSEAAFVRAFRREYGIPPATWRRQQADGPKLAA